MRDSLRYTGKVAIVTAAASGIGEAIARQLVSEGASLTLADINGDRLNVLQEQLGRDRCAIVRSDISRESDVERLVAHTKQRFGKLDVAFNVAGAARMGAILDQSEEEWRYGLDICLTGSFLCMKHEARQMISDGAQGSIVNVASINAQTPCWGLASYCAAKAGLEMLGRNGALEFADFSIRVNTVSPGLTSTPATAYMGPDLIKAYMERIPLKRQATAADQAEACLFLGSDSASYITGSNLVVDGGWQLTAYPDMRKHFTK
jgi:NAD(P)-dependent dehydrogenase (short-subunit alcohol dehydrogenase family)